MKKRFATILAATAVLGVTSAFAANPFSDVTPNDWAYQSVEQLAAAGVINGYPDGTFKGQNNITRYEMAQMVAKAMANQSRANAEQQAMINRLADEFSAELNNLGVRVSKLENQVGNFSFGGDARLRYRGAEDRGVFSSGASDKSKFDYRVRFQVKNQISDSTSATARLVMTSTFGETDDDNAGLSDVVFDRAYVSHNFGQNANVTAGRFGMFVGQGLIYDDAFDGAQLTIGNDKLNASVATGNMVAGRLWRGTAQELNYGTNDGSLTATVAQVKGKIGDNASLTGYYLKGNLDQGTDLESYGFGLDAKLADRVWVGGEWTKDANADNSNAWVAGLGYTNYNIAQQGTWGLKAQYFNEDVKSTVISSTWYQPWNSDYKGWVVSANYAVAKNVGLSAYYGFSNETQDGTDLSDWYRAQLDFKF